MYLQQTAKYFGGSGASGRHERRLVARLEVERRTVETKKHEAALVNAGATLEQKPNERQTARRDRVKQGRLSVVRRLIDVDLHW